MKEKKMYIVLGGSGKLGGMLINYLTKKYSDCNVFYTYNKHSSRSDKGKGIQADFLNWDSVNDLFDLLMSHMEENNIYDVCIINAIGSYFKENFGDFSIEKFNQTMSLQCTNYYKLLSFFLNKKEIKEILGIYISTNLTLRCNSGTFSYIASKSAAESITRQLAYQYRNEKKVRFNIIAPGYFGDMTAEQTEIKEQAIINDICRAVSFFSETEVVTGAKIVIDGGETIGY